MKIIGISGKIGTGKTTIANMLCNVTANTHRFSFGDILKKEVSETYGFPLEWCYSQEGKNYYPQYNGGVGILPWPLDNGHTLKKMNVREILQWYGTEYRRAQDNKYWEKEMRNVIEEFKHAEDIHFSSCECKFKEYIAVIDDVRFESEALLVKEVTSLSTLDEDAFLEILKAQSQAFEVVRYSCERSGLAIDLRFIPFFANILLKTARDVIHGGKLF